MSTKASSDLNESSSTPFQQQHCPLNPPINEASDSQSSLKDQHPTSSPPVDTAKIPLSDLNESLSVPFQQQQHCPTSPTIDDANDPQLGLKDQVITSPPPVDTEKIALSGLNESSSVPDNPQSGLKDQVTTSPPPVDAEKVLLSDPNQSLSVPFQQQHCPTSPTVDDTKDPQSGLKDQLTTSPPPVDTEKITLSELNDSSSVPFQQQYYPMSPTINDVGDCQSGLKDQNTTSPLPTDAGKVIIPDMFVLFLSQKPRSNPNYELVKLESAVWMKQTCKWAEKEHENHIRADLAYFASLWTSDAGPEEFRAVCDWVNWVFDFDDQFDEGELSKDPKNASEEVKVMIELMKSPNAVIYTAAHHPLRYVFQSVCQRVAKRSSPGTQRRYIKAMEGYFSAIVGQVQRGPSVEKLDIDSFIALRRGSIGVIPCLALIEYAYALDIPDELLEHPSIRTIETLATEFVILHNDVLSFHKEQSMGANHNIIHLLRQEGLSQQEAYNKVDLLLHERYRAWYVAHSEIPTYGEKIDAQVMLYVQGCLDVVLADLHWSFKTNRYFGNEGMVVRETRTVTLLP